MKKRDYTKYRMRICQTMHDCEICNDIIRLGEAYYDGGYGHRAHEKCIKNVIDFTLNQIKLHTDKRKQ